MKPWRDPDPEHEHLDWGAVQAFFYRTEAPEERTLLYHLLTRCEACREAVHPLLELRRAGWVDETTSPGEIELAISEWEAPRLWQELSDGAATAGDRPERLRDDSRWPTWGLVAWLARQSFEAAEDDPEAAVEWGRLAVNGASRLRSEEPAPEEWNMELRAFAQAALGNAHRARGDLETAEATFRTARQALEAFDDVADFLPFRPRVLAAEAALRREQRRYVDALELLDRAEEAWGVVNRALPEERARVRLQRAAVLDDLDDPEGACEEQRRAVDLLGPASEPALRLAAEIRLLLYLVRSGRSGEAAQRLPALRDLAAAEGTPADALRLGWVQASVHEQVEGDADRAETVLRDVLEGFCMRHMAYDAALASLDLARLLLTRERRGEVEEIALAVRPLFEELDVEPETRRALRTYMAAQAHDEYSLRGLGLLGPALLGGQPGRWVH